VFGVKEGSTCWEKGNRRGSIYNRIIKAGKLNVGRSELSMRELIKKRKKCSDAVVVCRRITKENLLGPKERKKK